MKTAFVLGTRPEIIKMCPIIRACETMSIEHFVIHTGQHYDYKMDKIFFEELELSPRMLNLGVGSGTHGETTGKMLAGIENILVQEKPDIVLVQGDTNSVLAGALASVKLFVDVGHVEAGLRSYDNSMPEEINRKLTDHMSSYLFAPTKHATDILLREGISKSKIYLTGNTIVDAVMQNIDIAEKKTDIHKLLDINDEYFLVTAHRQENVDNKEKLEGIFNGLHALHLETGVESVFPMHPRTKKMIDKFSISIPKGVKIIEPVGFLEFLSLESKAKLILTDSGGVQEEACILNVPCVTLRENTERPETVSVGANVVAGTDANNILNSALKMLEKKREWQNPLGNGSAGRQIMNVIEKGGGDCD